jgi:hypothetical protein
MPPKALTTVLEVGARGWLHPGWAGRYYPDDLPEDWRLAYYCNDYRVVLVPADYWRWAGVEHTARWEENSHAGFRFYLELPENLTQPLPEAVLDEELGRFLATLSPIAERIGGFTLDLSPQVPGEWLEPLLTRLVAFGPLYLERRAADDPVLARWLAEHGALSRWSGPLDRLPEAGKAAMACVSSAGGHGPADLRNWVAPLLGLRAGVGESVLFLGGDPPDVEDLGRIKVIAELLAGTRPP